MAPKKKKEKKVEEVVVEESGELVSLFSIARASVYLESCLMYCVNLNYRI